MMDRWRINRWQMDRCITKNRYKDIYSTHEEAKKNAEHVMISLYYSHPQRRALIQSHSVGPTISALLSDLASRLIASPPQNTRNKTNSTTATTAPTLQSAAPLPTPSQCKYPGFEHAGHCSS
jgi:hypothetical protein